MNELYGPWLTLSAAVPLAGAFWCGRQTVPERARKWSLLFCGLTLACTLLAWIDFVRLGSAQATEAWLTSGGRGEGWAIDALSAPLLPMAAVLYLLTSVATLRTKIRRFSFGWTLASEAIVVATLCCKAPWGVVALLAAGVVPPYLELRARRKPTTVYVVHMTAFVITLVGGWALVSLGDEQTVGAGWVAAPLLAAIFIRSGIAPFHCWMTDLFEHASFGTALLFVTPITGAYAAVRLVLPTAPIWVLHGIGIMALVSALHAAGMALVQHEARRFFCYLFLSNSALVLVGLDTANAIGLTGGLCVWLSIGIALAGFGLTLRTIESRHGRLSLDRFHGIYEHKPLMAAFFLLTGLASVGFPGTFGFVGNELLVEGAVETYPHIGIAVVVVAALNGIAVVKAYFTLFTGTRLVSSVQLGLGPREKTVVLAMAALIVAGGIYPQPAVQSRNHAAIELLRQRGRDVEPALAVRPGE